MKSDLMKIVSGKSQARMLLMLRRPKPAAAR
jgi:hypothetical protein